MDYDELLKAAQRQPDGADYHALRMAYTRTSAYQPYQSESKAVEKLNQAMQKGKLKDGLKAVETLLKHNYLDIEAHIAADFIYTQLADAPRSAYHRAFARGLLDAIHGTGDGFSPETAAVVISVSEEYTVVRLLGLQFMRQQLIEHDGHMLDAITALHPKSDQEVTMYFNIDLPHGWLKRRFSVG